jgi:hypothetical protein
MFSPSSTLQRPPNSRQQLWRYLSGERLLDLLRSEELFFAHLPVLEDQHEGALTRRSFEHMVNWFQRHNRSSVDQAYEEAVEYQSHREEFCVNCWHMNSHESYLMWKAYASRGYAVRTTFERLQASLDASEAAITGGVVEYVDFSRDLTPVGNVFNHVATKDMPYQGESEFRLVHWAVDPLNVKFQRNGNGVRVRVNLPMLIASVVRSPYYEPIEPQLEELLQRRGVQIESSSVKVAPQR